MSSQAVAFLTCFLEVRGSDSDCDTCNAKRSLCYKLLGYTGVSSHHRFLPDPFQFIIDELFQRWTLHVAVNRHSREVNNKFILCNI
jgi:hypothetical protein